jgi:DNA repair protein SbcC/Rad50
MTSSTKPNTPEPTTNSDADVFALEQVPAESPAQDVADSTAQGPDTAAGADTQVDISQTTGAASEVKVENTDEASATAREKRPADTRSEKEKLQNAIHGTSYKDQPTLLALQKRLERLSLENKSDSPEELAALTVVLEQRLSEHDNWQKKLVLEIETNIAQVTAGISDGKITEAQSQLDRSQSQLRKINADEQARLQTLIAPLKEELAKLLDWKKFAASEKKKELIGKMQAMGEDSTAPAQKAKLIRALQDEWKTLGHSDDNDALWIQFSELARIAFEPCKIYFKERKDKQASNLIARNNICEQLEAYAATLADTGQNNPVNLNELTRLENQARDDWKLYAPVAQNKINALQSRFNTVLTTLKQHRRHAMQSHNAAKLALIGQAKALVTHEDLSAAIQQAKSLQQQWKDLGPGSFKDDRKLWTDFRAACDALFARRDEAGKEKRQHGHHTSSNASSAAREVLKQISSLLSLDDEAFSESKTKYSALTTEFREALTPDLKNERKVLQDQFGKLSRQYEARLRATPDKKTLQLLQQVQAQASFCRELEERLLSGTDLTEPAEQLEHNWQDFEKVSDENLAQILKKRFRQLLQGIGDHKTLSTLTEKLEIHGRELCVEAEIMLGAETPAADKAIRMQQQLNQLQRGLGRMPPSPKEKIQRLQAMELELTAMGPLQAASRSSLENRLQQLKQKL